MYNFTVHVEYHEGKAAHFAGVGWRDCPYPQKEWPRRILDTETCTWSGEIFSQWFKWTEGWCDANDEARLKEAIDRGRDLEADKAYVAQVHASHKK